MAALLDMASGILAGLPPRKPLRDWERAILAPPAEEVFYMYGGNLQPEWALVIAAGVVAIGRWREAKADQADKAPLPPQPAAPPAVEAAPAAA